jgi:hypothetical protein
MLLNGIESQVERVDSVIPINNPEIVNGEIYTVKVISEKSESDLLNFKNKMINEVMYVMEVHILDEERHFKVFVTDPPKKKKKKKKILFDMSSFKYSPTNQGQSPEFLKIDIPYNLDMDENTKKIIWITLLSILIIIMILFSRKFIHTKSKKRKKRKKKLELAKSLMELLDAPKTREDFEMIYMERKVITENLEFNKPPFLKLLNEVNKYQYKEEWSEEDLNKVSESYRKLDEFKVSSGI